jgi:excisionase family DNA binding protein
METNTIKVVTVPLNELMAMITGAINSEIEKLIHEPALGSGFQDELWDRKQAADFLGISEQTLTKVFLEGRISGQKSGRKYHFLKSSVHRFLQGRNN